MSIIRRLTRPADTPPPSTGDFTIILVDGQPALRDREGNIYPLVTSGGSESGTVTSVGIIATSDINVVGSPITTAGTIALSLNYGSVAGTVCAGDDLRLSNSRTPTAHSHGSISNTGTIGDTAGLPLITTTGGLVTTGSFGTAPGTFAAGNHSHTPAELGAVATSALSTTATANSVVQRDSSGSAAFVGVTAEGVTVDDGTGPTVNLQPGLAQIYDGADITEITPTRADFGGEVTALGPISSPRFLVGNNIATAISSATVTVTVADHQGRWLPLTGSSGTQTIAMPASPALGAEFYFERRGAAALAFGSGYTVTNDQLSSVPVGGVFGMKCVNTSTLTYLFV
jgi:hypothetical protein